MLLQALLPQAVARRALIALALALPAWGICPAGAATPAEVFVSDNIQKGLGILHNGQLTSAQRSDGFEQLLLKITSSSQRAPEDFIVKTALVDPADHSGQPPLEIDFRVRSDTGKPELVDFGVAGVWIGLSQRDQFVAFLGQNGGDVETLTSHLRNVTAHYH